MGNPPTPLSPNEETALAQLTEKFHVADDALAHETAVDHLVAAGFVRGAAHDLIEQLRLKGYLSEVEDDVRLTEP